MNNLVITNNFYIFVSTNEIKTKIKLNYGKTIVI
jgi:hypothetical protein